MFGDVFMIVWGVVALVGGVGLYFGKPWVRRGGLSHWALSDKDVAVSMGAVGLVALVLGVIGLT